MADEAEPAILSIHDRIQALGLAGTSTRPGRPSCDIRTTNGTLSKSARSNGPYDRSKDLSPRPRQKLDSPGAIDLAENAKLQIGQASGRAGGYGNEPAGPGGGESLLPPGGGASNDVDFRGGPQAVAKTQEDLVGGSDQLLTTTSRPQSACHGLTKRAPPLPPRRPSGKSSSDAGLQHLTDHGSETSSRASPQRESEIRPNTSESLDRMQRHDTIETNTIATLPQPLGKNALAPTPPILPPRRVSGEGKISQTRSARLTPPLPPRTGNVTIDDRLNASRPQPAPRRSALSFGMNERAKPQSVVRASTIDRPLSSQASHQPPPVPLASRPHVSIDRNTSPVPKTSLTSNHPQTSDVCLHCRDFSAVDAHAARFPRQQFSSLHTLAQQLTAPFASATDRARVIFTWMHHNIAYDVVAFFNNAVRPSTPQGTLQSGLAVCEGYAGLYQQLATNSGLECIVVGGHGKGFGFAMSSTANEPVVPKEDPSGHAWNAVCIDNHEWKLIDPCWGAGHISGPGQPYTAHFSPLEFSATNAQFGLRHFPANPNHFFLASHQTLPSWTEYYLGPLKGAECLQVFEGVVSAEGISQTSFYPPGKRIPVDASSGSPFPRAQTGDGSTSSSIIHFEFARVCQHWSPTRNGPGEPFVFILQINGPDGSSKDFAPFETDGQSFRLDIERNRLGTPGQQIFAFAVETIDGQSGRGLTVEQYKMAKGRKAMGFAGLAMWVLV